MKKNAFITVLSTQNYLKGVIALFKSIENTNTKYPNFLVIINENIDNKTKQILLENNIQIIKKPTIQISEKVKNKNISSNTSNWNYTFDKFYLFDKMDFDKLVYLDSDMYVNKNIDELFEKENMSATIAGKSYPRQ